MSLSDVRTTRASQGRHSPPHHGACADLNAARPRHGHRCKSDGQRCDMARAIAAMLPNASAGGFSPPAPFQRHGMPAATPACAFPPETRAARRGSAPRRPRSSTSTWPRPRCFHRGRSTAPPSSTPMVRPCTLMFHTVLEHVSWRRLAEMRFWRIWFCQPRPRSRRAAANASPS